MPIKMIVSEFRKGGEGRLDKKGLIVT